MVDLRLKQHQRALIIVDLRPCYLSLQYKFQRKYIIALIKNVNLTVFEDIERTPELFK